MSLEVVRARMRLAASPEVAAVLQRFFKTGPGEYGEGDRFLGIKVPPLRALSKEFRGLGEAETLELLRSPLHEERLLALLILGLQYDKGDGARRQRIYELYLENRGWVNNWDLVDSSASYIVGRHLAGKGIGPLRKLARSKVLWDRRIAIIATHYFIRQGEYDPTLEIGQMLLGDGHDLIHKALGWMLREVGKGDPKVLEGFLRSHLERLPRTALRYAIERFPPALRRRYLEGKGVI